MLPAEVQEAELKGRLSSEVNADRVPGAKLVKAFNQLPWQDLYAPGARALRRRHWKYAMETNAVERK